ncbi:DoxX family protein [Bifidobacterium sp. ESL0775]|uniref:DoxX family membrane protein n=1 Tax=Bifidobacterium sp. ESL0775 TaxID=2983230 RepID=UPI0023F8FC36|nr:DoxX family protein [Bifidobacterium sp. ESL0775]WEV69097.1 DoxX family protein [Bifidobacterium sp. ESL0775]
MVKWLRTSKSGMIVATIVRIYLAIAWLQAGWEKVVGFCTGKFSAAGFIQMGISHPVPVEGTSGPAEYPWYTWFLQHIAMPQVNVFSFMVAFGEVAVGLGLLFGTLTTAAAFFGMLMNWAYVLCGVVSSGPIDIICEFIILVAGLNAGKIGLDRWIIPWLRSKIHWLGNSVFDEEKTTWPLQKA